MNEKHLNFRIKQCIELASLSNCPRRKFGALLLDPIRNVVLIDAYNGGPRGGSRLCAGETCGRIDNKIPSGTMIEVGCHHAEMNIICNAAAGGVCTSGAWLIVNGEPCVMCAKLIHHANIAKVVIVGGVYNEVNGIGYLKAHGVEVETREIKFKFRNLSIDGLSAEEDSKKLREKLEEEEEVKQDLGSMLSGLVERTLSGIKSAVDDYKSYSWVDNGCSKVLVKSNPDGTKTTYDMYLKSVRGTLVLMGLCGKKIVSDEKEALFHAFLHLKQNE